MAQQTWVFDAPTGVYKSHAMSMELFRASVEESQFMDFVFPIDGFGRGRGETVTLTRIANITEPTSPDLDEAERIPEDTFSLSTTAITVTEIGRAVPYTSLSFDLSEFDLNNPVQAKLREQMTLSLDTKAAAAFTGAQVKYIPTGLAAGTFDTDGTASTQATANLNVFHVEEVVDELYDTYFAAPFVDGDYVGIFRNLGLRGIKRDPTWEEWKKYTDPAAKFNGEVGRIENCRFLRTNHNNALGTVGSSSVLGEGVIFGERPVAMAESMTPELRAAIPDDFGRSKAVAWYGILAFGEVFPTANAGEAKIVHVTSS